MFNGRQQDAYLCALLIIKCITEEIGISSCKLNFQLITFQLLFTVLEQKHSLVVRDIYLHNRNQLQYLVYRYKNLKQTTTEVVPLSQKALKQRLHQSYLN